MITITDREALRLSPGGSARFEGIHHGAGVSFFWVAGEPGTGPERHEHPYSETWIVLAGTASIDADGEQLAAGRGSIVTVTAGSRHLFRSVGPERLEMICVHASPTIIQRFVQADAPAEPDDAVDVSPTLADPAPEPHPVGLRGDPTVGAPALADSPIGHRADPGP